VTAISVYLDAAIGNVKMAIYNSGLGKEWADDTGQAVTAGWNTKSELSISLSAGDYWLFWKNSDSGAYYYYETGTSNQGCYLAHAYATAYPASFTPDGYYDRAFAIYATYTPTEEGQDLTFINFENSKTFGSTTKSMELTRTFTALSQTWASATASFEFQYLDLVFILFEASKTYASNFISKELSFTFFGASKTWTSITTTFEGLAQDLTFILFESAKTWASIIATLPEIVYTVNDLIPLVVLAFILAIIALAIAILLSR